MEPAGKIILTISVHVLKATPADTPLKKTGNEEEVVNKLGSNSEVLVKFYSIPFFEDYIPSKP